MKPWHYVRAYYHVNRSTYELTRPAALWDAIKLTWRIRNHL